MPGSNITVSYKQSSEERRGKPEQVENSEKREMVFLFFQSDITPLRAKLPVYGISLWWQ